MRTCKCSSFWDVTKPEGNIGRRDTGIPLRRRRELITNQRLTERGISYHSFCLLSRRLLINKSDLLRKCPSDVVLYCYTSVAPSARLYKELCNILSSIRASKRGICSLRTRHCITRARVTIKFWVIVTFLRARSLVSIILERGFTDRRRDLQITGRPQRNTSVLA